MIQIDMQMPERCGVCFAMHTDEIGLESWCGIDEMARDLYTEEINTKRPDWCPLKEQEAIVRCKYCKWYDERISMCDNCGLPREQTFFCADGKRDGEVK